MKKRLMMFAFMSVVATTAFAGGLISNTNQNIHFLRNPARDASTEIDAVHTNPAGLTMLTDGFHLSLNNQTVIQTRTIESTFEPFKANNEGNATKTFNGKTNSPIVPSIQMAYKKDKYVLSAMFAVVGGGGKVTFDKGLASFESGVAMLPLGLKAKGLNTTAYSLDTYLEGSSYIFGLQLNGTYKISDAWSAALGLRVNLVENGYLGHITDIKINPVHPVLNSTGAMISAPDFFTTAGMTSYATATTDKQLDCSQSGWGVSPILSINYNQNGLNLAAKYEFKSVIDVTNDTKVDDTGALTNGVYADGVITPNDIPAFLSAGAQYKFCKKWTVNGGYHHFFDSDARMAKDKQKNIDGGLDEYLFGTEYEINDRFLISAGVQLTDTKVNDAYQSDMSYSLDSYSVGFGGAMKLTKDLKLNVGYFFTNYASWTKTSTAYNGQALAGTDVYDRTNNVFGVGLDYKF